MAETLKQGLCNPMHVTDQILVIYAGTRGYLDKVPVTEVAACEVELLRFIHERKQDLWQRITDAEDLDDETVAQLDEALTEFRKSCIRRQNPHKEPTATV
jgi:F-type H+-transporting ATPase subunit alpha